MKSRRRVPLPYLLGTAGLILAGLAVAGGLAFRREIQRTREAVSLSWKALRTGDALEALSPTLRYAAVLKVQRAGHGSVRLSFFIRNTCRSELRVMLPTSALQASPAAAPTPHCPWPTPGSRLCWSENENAVAMVGPDGVAFVVDLSEAKESLTTFGPSWTFGVRSLGPSGLGL